MKKCFIILSFLALSIGTCFSQANTNLQKENIIAQMNYCINSLTNIIHNKSMSVLEHESDQILNNLTIEQIIGLYEINDFRIDLLDAVGKFGITEQERALLRRIQSIKRDNMKWAALSNALDPTMLLTGSAGVGMGYQLAFQTLLTAARSAVEYQTMKGEQNIEELRAMWDLRKEDLKEINETRQEALKIVFSLYNKYHLSENDRLTESTANNFSTYISEENAAKRARLLEDNRATYEHIADYYYHLGMAYLDLNNYDKAKLNFTTYLSMYAKAPLLRYNEKSGCIALAILANEKNLSNWEKKNYIDNALKNLPHNSAAILQCAMIYLYDLNEQTTALNLIRAGIEDPKASDKSLLYMAAANVLPIAKQYPQLYSEIGSLFNEDDRISLDSYITYLINENEFVWSDIAKVITFKNTTYRRWYQWWIGKYFNDELHVILPERLLYDAGDISLYVEEHTSDEVTIRQLQTSYAYGIDITEFDDVDCFKANKDLKYLYFDVLVPEKTFILKRDIDYAKIQKENWHRQSEFELSKTDIEDIIDFCKDNTPKRYATELACEYLKCRKTDKSTDELKVKFYGNEPNYDIHHSSKQLGYYLRITLANGINLLYKFENGELVPYMYSFKEKTIFAKEEFKDEYEYIEISQSDTVEQNKLSWWGKIKGLFSKNNKGNAEDATNCKSDNVQECETNEKPSWWKNTWNNITSLFSKTKQEESEAALNIESNQEQKTAAENELSWWKKVWNNTTSIFSSTESEKEEVVANDKKEEKEELKEETNSSWLKKTWNKATGIFSSTEQENKDDRK